jgi:hypothetical protein
VATTATVLGLLSGSAVAFVTGRVGAPATSGALAWLAFAVVFVLVGRRAGLHGWGNWVRAVSLTMVMSLLVPGIAIFCYAVWTYG